MKVKPKFWMISGCLVVLLGIIGVLRYQQVNANPQQRGVIKEVLIKKGQLVHAENVDFKVSKVQVLKKKDQVTIPVTLAIKQTGPANYGHKKGNPNYIENMWLNIPYSMSSQTDTIFDKNKIRIKPAMHPSTVRQPLTLQFSATRTSYDHRNQKMRFSFLVPVENYLVKYSLLLE